MAVSPAKRLFVLGVILVAAVAVADWNIIAMQRAAAIDNLRTAITNLANGMAAQTTRSLTVADRALLEVCAALTETPDATSDGIRSQMGSRRILELLVRKTERLADINALALADPTGRIVNTTSVWPQAGLDISGQDFFRYLSAHDDSAAFVGLPMKDPSSGTSGVFLAHRINAPGGEFAGVVLAEISLADLQDFYRLALASMHRTIMVLRRDGTVLIRYPNGAGAVGRKLPENAPWHADVAAGGGTFIGPGYFDNAPIIAVVRPLGALPLVIQASVAEADALAGWYMKRLWLILGGIIAAGIAIVLVRLFANQINRLDVRNRQLEDARRQLDAALSNISQGLSLFDGENRLIVCNQRFNDLYHLPVTVTQPGTPLVDMLDYCLKAGGFSEQTRDELLRARANIEDSGESNYSILQMADGRMVSVQQQAMPDGGWVATHEDITERRRHEEKITFLASHDPLTGLPNRSMLMQCISQLLPNVARGDSFAILFLDLDGFKAVNDTLGHMAGDELLQAVTRRLLTAVRDSDTVARLGGDEFVVLQISLHTPQDAVVLAERIIAKISAPFIIGHNEVTIGVSVGIDIANCPGVQADTLLKNADTAMYACKAAGKGTYRLFSKEMDAAVQTADKALLTLHVA
jgi:diguanylate cyclase (GGDEF)-like protein